MYIILFVQSQPAVTLQVDRLGILKWWKFARNIGRLAALATPRQTPLPPPEPTNTAFIFHFFKIPFGQYVFLVSLLRTSYDFVQ